MKNIFLEAKDGLKINVSVWDEVKNPVGAVQIAHGMAEYSARYNNFAMFLNSNGYIVLADDHRGHGLTVGPDNKGLTSGDSFNDTLDDMGMLTEYIIKTYKLPVILLGHSYGSFLTQAYVQKYNKLIKGALIVGSAYMNSGLVKMGATIARIQKAFLGEKKPAKLITKLSFGSYDKPFKAENQKFAWLSRNKDNVTKYLSDPYCGYTMCIGFQSSFLNNVHKLYTEQRMNMIPKDFPILIMSGEFDPVGENGKLVKQLFDAYKSAGLNRIDFKIYPNDRHEILNEVDNSLVYNDVLAFIKKVLA